jgi:predicted esterase YcpF (UPF0227 family)
MIYIYLHGFNSAFDPEASKVKTLSSLGEVIGITYDTYVSYDEIFSYITSQVPSDRSDEVIFVGTSLGGRRKWESIMDVLRLLLTLVMILVQCFVGMKVL